MKQYLTIKKSQIHGQGLFSTRNIKKGATLGQCEVKPSEERGEHTLWVNEDLSYDVTCKLRYINHSKNANVAYYDNLNVVAVRNIRKGDELFHDYGEEWA